MVQFWRGIKNVIWPQPSLITNRVSGTHAALLSADEHGLLRFVSKPMCVRCGAPEYFGVYSDGVCAQCEEMTYHFDVVRAALEYDEYSRSMIFGLKRAGHRHGLAQMARWMQLAAGDLIRPNDVFVPVPLHFTRLARRGYNQALWLAAAMSRNTKNRVIADALRRNRATPPQGRMDNRARRLNVDGVFEGNNSINLSGKRVILIDDVYTTGATVDACAKALKQKGALFVGVITLARIVNRETQA